MFEWIKRTFERRLATHNNRERDNVNVLAILRKHGTGKNGTGKNGKNGTGKNGTGKNGKNGTGRASDCWCACVIGAFFEKMAHKLYIAASKMTQ